MSEAKTWVAGSNAERNRVARAVPAFLYAEGQVLRNLGEVCDYLNALEARAALLDEAESALESARWQASMSTLPFAQKIGRDLSAVIAKLKAAPTGATEGTKR